MSSGLRRLGWVSLLVPLVVGLVLGYELQVRSHASRLQIIDDRLDEVQQRAVSARYLSPGPLRLAEEIRLRQDLANLEVQFAQVQGLADGAPSSSKVVSGGLERIGEFAERVRLEVVHTRAAAHQVRSWCDLLIAIESICLLVMAGIFWWPRRFAREIAAVPTAEIVVQSGDFPDVVPEPAVVERVAGPVVSSRVQSSSTHPSGAALMIGRLQGRVLLIEDNPINQRVTMRQLSELGLDVDLVGDAETGLERLRHAAYMVVLMDLQLPGMDGLSATRVWRDEEQQLKRARCPIIALTANALSIDRDTCRAAGMDGYLSKPVRLHDLHRTLVRFEQSSAPSERTMVDPAPPFADTVPTSMPAHLTHDSGMWSKLRAETSSTDPRMLEDLLADLRAQAPVQINAIVEALANGSGDPARSVAHRLKGSAAMLGLPRLSAAAKAIEIAAKAGDLATATESLGELQAAAEATFTDPKVKALLAL